MVVGTLRGFDQFMNLVIDNTVEVNGDERNDIGMVVCFLPYHPYTNTHIYTCAHAIHALFVQLLIKCILYGD